MNDPNLMNSPIILIKDQLPKFILFLFLKWPVSSMVGHKTISDGILVSDCI